MQRNFTGCVITLRFKLKIKQLLCIRCGKCYTKNYCSKDCQAEDWEEKHQRFCSKEADKRKVKGGCEVRHEKERELLEKISAHWEAAECGDNVKKELKEVTEMCAMMTDTKIGNKV